MNRSLTGFLNIIGILILLAWAPGAAAASWSSTVCNPPPTYGPYCCTKYYCPAAGSYVPTTVLTGSIASNVAQCTSEGQTNCIFVTDRIELAQDQAGVPNQLIQCGVPGGDTCKNPGKCGGSSGSSGTVFLNLNFAAELTSELDSSSCTRDGKNKQIKCQKSQRFAGLEGDAQAAAQYCANPNWEIIRWLALRLTAYNVLVTSDGTLSPTTFYCRLQDPNGLFPGDTGYAPDLVTLSNNHYICDEVQVP